MDKVNVKHVVPRGSSEMCDSDHGCEKPGSQQKPYLLSSVPPTLVILSSQVTDCFSREPSRSSPCYFVDRSMFFLSLLKSSICNAGDGGLKDSRMVGEGGTHQAVLLPLGRGRLTAAVGRILSECVYTHIYTYTYIHIYIYI